jgi:tetratricopeptide (TPR) repeat protein
MTSSETVAAFNEKSLNRIVRTVRLSEGEFSLILAHCNYTGLRRKMLDRLKTMSPSDMREIELPDSVRTVYTFLRDRLRDDSPDAVSILGLESVRRIDDVLGSANQVREEFGKNFPFPVIWWINDPLLDRFIRVAPDFRTWAGSSVRFKPEPGDLLDALRHEADRAGEIREGDDHENDRLEFFLKSFSEDAGDSELNLTPEHHADLCLLRGRNAQNKEDWDAALGFYQESLSFWEQTENRERTGLLRCFIAKSYEYQGDTELAESHFRACAEDFAACGLGPAESSGDLCRILRKLKKWEELENTAEKFSQSGYLSLARARQGKEAAEQLEAEREKDVSDADPELHIEILDALHQLYFDQGKYVEAFRAKQDKYSLEHQYGFRAFVGAGRLKASRKRRQTRGE